MAAKILLVAEAVTLAHVVRLVTLGDMLIKRGWQVVLATDPRYSTLVGPQAFEVVDLYTMPGSVFQKALAYGTPIFDFPTLDRYVADELALYQRIQPQCVVSDFRISLAISARVAKIPYVNVTNAYWNPLAKIRRIVPEFEWVQKVGVGIAQIGFSAFQRVGYFQHAIPVNRIRRKHGLQSIGGDFRTALMDGDITCFSDFPQVIPTAALPSTQHFIGPLLWSPPVAPPPWWADMLARERKRPLVYVSLGSSGPGGMLQTVLDGLANLPVDVIASAAGKVETLKIPPNARVADLLPGDQACMTADLVVCNGGSPGTYQAMVVGKPVMGIATNMDQFLNMAAVEDAGCGRLLRSRSVTGEGIRRVAAAMLEDSRMQAQTADLAQTAAAAATQDALAPMTRFFSQTLPAPN